MITFEEFMGDLTDVPFDDICLIENYLKTTSIITQMNSNGCESFIKNMIHHSLRKGIDVNICQYLVKNTTCAHWRDFVVSNFKVMTNLNDQKILDYPGRFGYTVYYPVNGEYITHIAFHEKMAIEQNKPDKVNIVCVSGMLQSGTYDLIYASVKQCCDPNTRVLWWQR